MSAGKIVTPRLKFRLLLRSLLLQASWNFERMQGLGAAYILAPILRRLYSGADLQRALLRYSEYFNTHPFLAPAIFGAIMRIEVETQGDEDREGEGGEFRDIMMAPAAAMGDAFFWGGVRPLAAVAGVFAALQGLVVAPLILLLVFNLPHLSVRIVGFLRGCRDGVGIVDLLERCRLPDLAIRLKQATVVLLGLLCAGLTLQTLRGTGGDEWLSLVTLPLLLLIGWPTRKSVSPLLLALAASVGVLAIHSLF